MQLGYIFHKFQQFSDSFNMFTSPNCSAFVHTFHRHYSFFTFN